MRMLNSREVSWRRSGRKMVLAAGALKRPRHQNQTRYRDKTTSKKSQKSFVTYLGLTTGD